jgi:hypothetical protein
MADALLVAAQHINEDLLGLPSSKPFDQISDPFCTRTLQTYGPFGSFHFREGQVASIEINKPWNETFLTVEAHLSRAQNALEHLARYEQRVDRDKQFSEEMKWLAANKQRYAGRWIALEGEHLLAVGNTSREVFSQLPANVAPPLVIRIDEEDVPFAGW